MMRDSTFGGRIVSGASVVLETVELSTCPGVGMAGFSCSVALESDRVFLGSTTGDSVLLGCTLGGKAVERGGVSVGMNDTADDLDKIYGDDDEEATVGAQGKLRLRVHDYLLSTAPIRDATFAIPALTDVPS